jgi:diaminopimelate decarboxylase
VNQKNNFHPVSAGRDKAGCFTIAGHSLAALAEQFGTPLYIYDGATIEGQAKRLRALLKQYYPGSYEITYAAKAYFSLGMARRLAALNLGVDVVSLGELSIARKAGFAPERVHLHGNNKSATELAAALEWGIQSVVVDNLEELEILESLAESAGRRMRIWLRISPGVTADTHSYLQTSHHTSKFGLPLEGGQAENAIRRAAASRWLDLKGLHTHLGSQIFDTQPYKEAIARLMALAEAAGFVPEELSPGGGWGVPYLPDQPDNDPEPWIQAVSEAVRSESAARGWHLPHLVVEPGRWLSAQAGLAIYTVGTQKTAGDGTRFVAVDGGMADNLRPALYQARYSACLAHCPDAKPVEKVSVVGKYCESGDLLIPEIWLPEVRRGDLLVMPVAGAYQLSMASNYNLSQRPAVLWLEPGRMEVLQKREQLEASSWWMEGEG